MDNGYVGFEIAKLLKESGFNEKCEYCYAYFDDDDVRIFELKPIKKAQNLAENRYPCVSQQSAMAWLRKNYIFIDIDTIITTDKKVYFSARIRTIEDGWSTIAEFLEKSYEVVVDMALEYCCKYKCGILQKSTQFNIN